MQIIPVIDVQNSVAVHARGGDRINYRPLQTPFSASSEPISVAQGLVAAFSAKTLYLADLDGIERGAPDWGLYSAILDAVPEVVLWIDNGTVGWADEMAGHLAHRLMPVVGSESLDEMGSYHNALSAHQEKVVLSLDFQGTTFLGPAELLNRSDLWPRDVIAMSLGRVGMSDGPDFERLKSIAGAAGLSRHVFVAGGVRGLDDLHQATEIGAHGALLASALHAEKIKPDDLEEVAGF